MGSSPTRLLPVLFLLATLAPIHASAQTFTCGTSDTTLGPPISTEFHPFRPGAKDVHLIWRDTEFMWDALYPGGLTDDVRLTLAALANNLVMTVRNPFGALYGDVHLIYEYFRREGLAYNTTDPADTASMFIGNIGEQNHTPRDRSHVDCYVFHPSRGGYDGLYPSGYLTPDEDLSSDRPLGDVKHANSLHLKGPPEGQTIDVGGTGWTAPDKIHNVGIMHEFQHSLPPHQGAGASEGSFSTELFSAAAEAVAGNADATPVVHDTPYTWSLLAQSRRSVPSPPGDPCAGGGPSPTCVRAMASNYQGRSLFAAYLAYGFRGTDTLAVLPGMSDGMSDDLLWRWARSPGRNLGDLQGLLSDVNCGTCATKNYFRPDGVALDPASRMALLHHNWRVANYVNNYSLDEGQYGYPPQFGFAPGTQVKAWQDNDGIASDDLVAIPPEVTLTSSHRTRPMILKGERSFGGNTYPLVLQPYGAEYWVVRSDSSIWTPGQDLVVRVTPEDLYRVTRAEFCGFSQPYVRDARLVASVVAYAPPSESVAESNLWEHAEWAARAFPPKWVDVDSLGGALEFVVPSFGDSFKAAVVVLSLGNGPAQYFGGPSFGFDGLKEYVEALHYRINLALRSAPYQSSNPNALLADPTKLDESPAWSPTGNEVAFVRLDPSTGVSGIYRKQLSGGAPVLLGTAGTESRSEPDWSPRGDWIAFSREAPGGSGDGHIWVVNRWTQEQRQITSGQGLSDASPAFEPHGQRIAYIRSYPGQMNEPQVLNMRQLRRINLDGTGDILLADLTPMAGEGSLRWSPDGRFVYFARNGSLHAVPGDGGSVIPRPGLLTGATSFDLHCGSGGIVFEQHGSMPWMTTCFNILTSSEDTTLTPIPFRRLALRDTIGSDTQPRFYRTGAEFFNPRWSPDGTRIAYSSNQNTTGDRDLFVGQVSYNHAPQLAPLPDQMIPAGPTFVLEVQAYEPDGEALTFDAPSRYLPPGASFDPGTHRLTWINPGPPMSEHFLLFRVMDGSGGVATRAVKIAVAAPAIADLNLDVVASDLVWLSWTAPGASGGPAAAEYDLRYAQFPINDTNFDIASRAWDAPTPAAPGAIQSHMIDELSSCTPYWFAIKSKDAGGNWSPISNVPSTTTMCGGGGGGGSGEQSAREVGPSLASIGPGRAETAFARPGGADSTHVALVVEMSGTALAPRWSVHYLPPEEQAAVEGDGFSGIVLQAPSVDGTWLERARLDLSGTGWRFGLRALRRPARLIFLGAYDLQQTWNVVAPGGANTANAMTLTSARHSRDGDLTTALGAADGYDAGLGEGDTLTLRYAPTTSTYDAAPPWFMVVGPAGSTGDLQGFRGRLAGGTEARPTAFALRQNRPNPFSGRTAIHFDLPVETRVRLEIFDAQGRRVRMLAEGTYPAGFHALEWDHRADGGQALGAGVYLYRIHAGAFREQRKMVLLAR